MSAHLETIRQAYGRTWEIIKNNVNEFGWVSYGFTNGETYHIKKSEVEEKYLYGTHVLYWRPRSLEWLETKNYGE